MISSIYSNMNDNLQRTIQGKVELYKSSTNPITFLPEDNLQEISVERTGETNKFFGFGIGQKATIKILYKQKNLNFAKGDIIRTSFRADKTNPYQLVCPPFYIKEITRNQKTYDYTITAYDSLDFLTAFTWKDLGLVAPYTLAQVVYRVNEFIGVNNIELPSAFDFVCETEANFNGDENLRLVLNAVADATQTIYFINSNNELCFVELFNTPTVLNINKRDYFELSTEHAVTISKVMHTTELGDNVYDGDDSGEVCYIRDNPFWNNRTDIGDLVKEATNRVKNFYIVPYNIKWRGNFLTEPGDKVTIQTKGYSAISTFILNDSFTYTGGFVQNTQWKYSTDNYKNTAANVNTIGAKINQTSAKVDKVNKEIQLLVSDVSDNKSQMAQIKLDLQGIDLTLQQHQEQIDNIEIPEVDLTEVNEKIAAIELEIDNIELSVQETSTQILTDAKQYTDEQVTNVTTTIDEKIATLQVTTEGINATVSSLQSTVTNNKESADAEIDRLVKEVNLKMDEDDVTILVSNKLENGVDKVTTASKKYTFDDKGLNVSSSGNNLSTMITEDGMQVYRAGQEVLTANNEGVKAEDLHATTYLIIGNNSRLEDRLNRTACYWIGD